MTTDWTPRHLDESWVLTDALDPTVLGGPVMDVLELARYYRDHPTPINHGPVLLGRALYDRVVELYPTMAGDFAPVDNL